MYTDLFLALKDPDNPRGHPILAALAYTFCPSAARWWLAGAEPVMPFDPLWKALTDLGRPGKTLENVLPKYGFDSHALDDPPPPVRTLKEVLLEYGFGTLVERARKYIEQVDAYRNRHGAIRAPELLPTFQTEAVRVDIADRYGSQAAIDRLGGNWADFFPYIRTWAFLVDEWAEGMKFSTEPEIRLERLGVILPGVRRTLRFPTWVWQVQIGHQTRLALGLLIENQAPDQLRLALAQIAGSGIDKPWPVPPEVYALDQSGLAEAFDAHLALADLPRMIERLAQAAEKNIHPPLSALQGSARCLACGYHAQCFNGAAFSSLALSF